MDCVHCIVDCLVAYRGLARQLSNECIHLHICCSCVLLGQLLHCNIVQAQTHCIAWHEFCTSQAHGVVSFHATSITWLFIGATSLHCLQFVSACNTHCCLCVIESLLACTSLTQLLPPAPQVGIIGAGRIGSAYARMMVEGHKMNLVYYDPYPNTKLEEYIRK